VTEKHREQLGAMLRRLADHIDGPYEDVMGFRVDVTAAMGLRAPNGELTIHVCIADPDRRLYGLGIEGLVQLGPDEFSFDKAEVAEHLSTLLAQAAINLRGPS
jgi:hypothetical protein